MQACAATSSGWQVPFVSQYAAATHSASLEQLVVQAPAVAYAILLPGLAVHSVFGVLSGVVSYQLLKPLKEFRRAELPGEAHAKSAE